MRDLRLSERDRLVEAVLRVSGAPPGLDSPLWTVPLAQPQRIRTALRRSVSARTVVVTGTLERRLVLFEHEPEGDSTSCWTVVDLSGQPHYTRSWPAWVSDHLTISDPDSWFSAATITAEGRRRLLQPRLLLASLCHPENFPLPRFPLAISDLARAARATLLGEVELMDMQLGVSLDDVLARLNSGSVDILGISASFGQHDLMIRLLDEVASTDHPPMLVAGGSLTVRNERLLLDRYPRLIIGRGAGEPTIADALLHWHDDLALQHVRGAGHAGGARGDGTLSIGPRRRRAVVANRLQPDIWPELDLLDHTFASNGVAQLETSRGCTNYCSFCPRGHKGQWAGAAPDALPWIVKEIGAIADRHPHASRTLYLVDEEFIGRGADAPARALAVADVLHDAGFSWETSCRVDQAVRLDHSRAWHVERGQLWRGLVERGLRRCLFGVESGVTSILERFTKETTGTQNALAIRTLTALGVPPRFTYITFDQLMSFDELQQTHEFQGRTDLLLRPATEATVEEIVDGVRDEAWVAAHTTGRPFYTGISYLLVSMECLIGAAYTRKAEAAGLTGRADPSMGRVQARFADWRIGIAAQWAQLWIDRNFPFDYTLKSLEKVVTGEAHSLVRDVRVTIKTAGYRLLGGLIDAAVQSDLDIPREDELNDRCAALADHHLAELRSTIEGALAPVSSKLPDRHRDPLEREHARWAGSTTWRLINAGDSCGT